MATTISYNSISLGFIRTLSINQEAIREPSNSDYIYTKITIKVASLLNAGTPIAGINPLNGASQTPAQQLVAIRAALMTDCATLTYAVGGQTIFSSPGVGAHEDAKHGPIPLYCNVTRVDGSATFLIEFGIETYIFDTCPVGNKLPHISNRWSETHQLNEHGITTRIIKGTVIYRGDAIDDKKGDLTGGKFPTNTPDSFRSLVPPAVSVPKGFKRISFEVTVPEDGLGLQYNIVDQEQYNLPPTSMTKFEAEYAATSTYGGIWNDRCTVRGWSHISRPKADMIRDATSLCVSVFEAKGIAQGINEVGGPSCLVSASVSYKLHENFVEVTFNRKNAGSIVTKEGLNVQDQFKNLPNLDFPQPIGHGKGAGVALNEQGKDNKGRKVSLTNTDALAQIGVRGSANLGMIAFDRYLGQCLLPSGETHGHEAPKGQPVGAFANI